MYLHNKQKLFLKRFSFAGNAVKNSIIVFYDFFIYMQSKAMLTNKAKLSIVVRTFMLLLLLDTINHISTWDLDVRIAPVYSKMHQHNMLKSKDCFNTIAWYPLIRQKYLQCLCQNTANQNAFKAITFWRHLIINRIHHRLESLIYSQ